MTKHLSCSKLISEQKTKEKGGRKEMQTMTSAYANKMLKSLRRPTEEPSKSREFKL